MLTRILLAIFITIIPVTAISQNTEPDLQDSKQGVWSISYNAGFAMDYDNSTGHKISFEVGYSEGDSKAFLFNISSAKLFRNRDHYLSIYECTVGPRFYILENERVYLEGNIGAQINSQSRRYYDWYPVSDENYYSSKSRAAFCLAAGFGTRVMISPNNALMLRVKYNTTMPSTEGYTYINALFGLEFNTVKNNTPNKIGNRKITFSVGGGINSPTDMNARRNNGDGTLMIEGAVPTNFNGEIYGEASYNRIKTKSGRILNHFISLNIGPRFFINRGLLNAFLEFGGGMYILADSDDDKSVPLHPGLSIGTGFTTDISGFIGLFAKGKIHFIFTDNRAFPPYSTLTGGMRFNL